MSVVPFVIATGTTAWLVALVAPAVGILVAGVLLAVALRGRRVDDHPVCRRCGFDLFGKPPDAARCSECGTDLNRRRATRVGNRDRRGRLLAAALPALVVCIGWQGAAGWRASRAGDFNRHKPLWWLMRNVDRGAAGTRDAALGELAQRLAEGRLPPDVEASLVDRALAHQADLKQPWVPAWGGVVESAHAARRLSADRWARYVDHAVVFSLDVPQPAVRRGDDLVVRLVRGPDRVAAPGPGFDFSYTPDDAIVVGGADGRGRRTVPLDSSTWGSGTVSVPAGPTDVPPGGALGNGTLSVTDAVGAPLADGPQVARLKVTVQLSPRTTSVLAALALSFLRDAPAREMELEATWTLLPPGPETRPSDDAGAADEP